jgi:hypothetical protein
VLCDPPPTAQTLLAAANPPPPTHTHTLTLVHTPPCRINQALADKRAVELAAAAEAAAAAKVQAAAAAKAQAVATFAGYKGGWWQGWRRRRRAWLVHVLVSLVAFEAPRKTARAARVCTTSKPPPPP